MLNIPISIIVLCYVLVVLFWIANAFSTKNVVKKTGGWKLRITAVVIVFIIISLQKNFNILSTPVLGHSFVLNIISDVVTVLGAGVMIWARVTLGKNWSADIALKENHELIVSGPYKYVRHPIYSGLLLILLGSTLYSATYAWIFTFVIFCFGAAYKARREEELLMQNFSEYPKYKQEVKMLVPFLF